MFLGFSGQLNEALKDVEKVVGIEISVMLEKSIECPAALDYGPHMLVTNAHIARVARIGFYCEKSSSS